MMRRAFIEAEKRSYPVRMLCRVLQVSPAAYYRWRHRSDERHQAEAALRVHIVSIHRQSNGTYGAPRITHELRHQGFLYNHKRVARLMQAELISGLVRPRFRRPHYASDDLPDLVMRAFTAPAPNRLWMADVTQIPTAEGWLFLAAVLDAYSRRLVGWAFGEMAETELVAAALDMAITRRRPERGLIHHSDRGSVYLSVAYGSALRSAGFRQSAGAARCCWDNAAMESFFASLKKDRLYRRRTAYPTRQEAVTDTFDYMEAFYNRQRLHSTLGYLSPIDYETHAPAA